MVSVLVGLSVGVTIGAVIVFWPEISDWWNGDPIGTNIAKDVAKRTAEKTFKRATGLNVPKPANCKEYDDILKDIDKTTKEEIEPYGKTQKDLYNGGIDGLAGY